MIFRIKLRWWSALVATAVLLAAAWLLAPVVAGRRLTESLAGRFDSVATALVAGVIAGAGCGAANLMLNLALRRAFGDVYRRAFRQFALDVVGGMRPTEAAAGGLMAGLGEEPLFRGVLLPAIGPPVVGVFASAVIFGFAHWLRREYWGFLIWGMGEGVAFGTLYVVTDSLVVPAVAHAGFDTVGFLYFQRLRAQEHQASTGRETSG